VSDLLDALAIVIVLLKMPVHLDYMKARKGKKNVEFAGEAAITRAKEEHIVKGEGYGETVRGYGDRCFRTRWSCLLWRPRTVQS